MRPYGEAVTACEGNFTKQKEELQMLNCRQFKRCCIYIQPTTITLAGCTLFDYMDNPDLSPAALASPAGLLRGLRLPAVSPVLLGAQSAIPQRISRWGKCRTPSHDESARITTQNNKDVAAGLSLRQRRVIGAASRLPQVLAKERRKDTCSMYLVGHLLKP